MRTPVFVIAAVVVFVETLSFAPLCGKVDVCKAGHTVRHIPYVGAAY